MSEVFWFLLFCFFLFFVPFKWWQAREQENNLRADYEKQSRQIQWDNDVARQTEQGLGQQIQTLKQTSEENERRFLVYQSLYYQSEEKLMNISDYIYDNDLEGTPSGEHILKIIEEHDEE